MMLSTAHDIFSFRGLINEYLSKRPIRLSSYSFVNCALWKDFFDFRCKRIDDALCIFADTEIGTFLYCPPLAQRLSADVIARCFSMMRTINGVGGISRIENVDEKELTYFPADTYEAVKKSNEYLYRPEDIIMLSGATYKSKRSSYNYFIKNHSARCVPFNKEMLDECLALYDLWAHNRCEQNTDDMYIQMIKENRVVHEEALRMYEQLGLTGHVVIIDGNICAYSFGYRLTDEILCIAFEITNLSFNGLSVYVFRHMCQWAKEHGYRYINAMDDCGLENIAATKRSFGPCAIVPSYTIRERMNG